MSDTPRIDAIMIQTEREGAGYALALLSDVACQLERELACERSKRKAAERRLSEYKSSLEALVSAWA